MSFQRKGCGQHWEPGDRTSYGLVSHIHTRSGPDTCKVMAIYMCAFFRLMEHENDPDIDEPYKPPVLAALDDDQTGMQEPSLGEPTGGICRLKTLKYKLPLAYSVPVVAAKQQVKLYGFVVGSAIVFLPFHSHLVRISENGWLHVLLSVSCEWRRQPGW